MNSSEDKTIRRADYVDAAADAFVLLTGKSREKRAVAGEVLNVIGKNWMDNKSPHASDLERLHAAVERAMKAD